MTRRAELILTFTIQCKAPEELFTKDFDDLTPEEQALFDEDKIPCRESGKLWVWVG